MEEAHIDTPENALADATGRRDALRVLGAAGAAFLAALGFAERGAAKKHKSSGGKGRHSKNHRQDREKGQAAVSAEGGPPDGIPVPLIGSAGSTGPASTQPGPQGVAGPTGPAGPPGQAGSGGTAVIRVGPWDRAVATEMSQDPGVESMAHCEEGEHAVGGGYNLQNLSDGRIWFIDNHPIPDTPGAKPTGWLAGWNNGPGNFGGKAIQAYVICVPD